MGGHVRRIASLTWPVLAVPLITAAFRRPDTGTAFCAGSCLFALRRPVLAGSAPGLGRDPVTRASFRQLGRGAPPQTMLLGGPAVHLPVLGLRGGVSRSCSSTAAETSGGQPDSFCYARSVEGEAQTSLVLDLGGRMRTLIRLQEDPLSATLDRLLRVASEAERKEQGWVQQARKGKKVKGKGKKKRQAAAAVAVEEGGGDDEMAETQGPDPAEGWTAVLEGPSGAAVEVIFHPPEL